MVDDDVTALPAPADRPVLAVSTGPAPCAARPGSPLVHPEGRCECFFGGTPPEFGTTPTTGSPLP